MTDLEERTAEARLSEYRLFDGSFGVAFQQNRSRSKRGTENQRVVISRGLTGHVAGQWRKNLKLDRAE